MTVRADHVESSQRSDDGPIRFVCPAQPDIGASSGHVGRDGDGTERSGRSDDTGFLSVVPGVQNFAANTRLDQTRGKPLGFLDRERADEDRPPGCMLAADFGDDRPFLGLAVAEEEVGSIEANGRPVSGDDDDVETILLEQLQ